MRIIKLLVVSLVLYILWKFSFFDYITSIINFNNWEAKMSKNIDIGIKKKEFELFYRNSFGYAFSQVTECFFFNDIFSVPVKVRIYDLDVNKFVEYFNISTFNIEDFFYMEADKFCETLVIAENKPKAIREFMIWSTSILQGIYKDEFIINSREYWLILDKSREVMYILASDLYYIDLIREFTVYELIEFSITLEYLSEISKLLILKFETLHVGTHSYYIDFNG